MSSTKIQQQIAEKKLQKKNKPLNKNKTYIIIPGLNEAKHIASVVERTKKQGFENVVFVDDGSCDESSINAKRAGAIVLKHIVNMGKGAAAKTGCDYALKQGAEILILMDADGQHKPEDLNKFLKKIKTNDIVFGYRTLNKNMPLIMRMGNQGINILSQIINGISLRDTQSGFRCMTTNTYKKVRWYSNNYSMESEMISNVAKHKLKFEEIPIETIYLDNYKGTTILDGLKIFINMLKFKMTRVKK
ncbi:MAG: glycosyltransferase family 2 protein [Candidatus Woesearchaeota archaeon]|jgi:glycosyltransferase involved in cell wall biosynthesis